MLHPHLRLLWLRSSHAKTSLVPREPPWAFSCNETNRPVLQCQAIAWRVQPLAHYKIPILNLQATKGRIHETNQSTKGYLEVDKPFTN